MTVSLIDVNVLLALGDPGQATDAYPLVLDR
jgi:hypothetical protein